MKEELKKYKNIENEILEKQQHILEQLNLLNDAINQVNKTLTTTPEKNITINIINNKINSQ